MRGDEKRNMLPILILHPDNVALYAFDKESGKYVKEKEYALENPKGIAIHKGHIFALTENRLLKFTKDLKKELDVPAFTDAQCIKADENIFVCADRALFAFDENLREIGRVETESKTPHDILIHENIAYLLDNLLTPVLVFRIDVSDPENMRVLNEMLITGVNIHLSGQWINPELNQWLIIQSSDVMGGASQEVIIYSLKDPEIELAKRNVYSLPWYDIGKIKGVRIDAVTGVPPIWAVVNKDGSFYLSKVSTVGNRIRFSSYIEVEIGEESKEERTFLSSRKRVVIKRDKHRLFISRGKYLNVVETKDKKEVILSQEMNGEIKDMALIQQ